ncbi:MAG: transglycosylase domain-containing protein [Chitinophagaceae bacterium]|nr:transglycosylase domain-containing protein [Oligoflexus sp.]
MAVLQGEKKKWVLTIAFAALVVLSSVLLLLTPPVWQLRKGPIEVVRWPKTGAEVFVIGPDTPRWTPIHTVSQHVINAIMVSEDARYYEHGGLDWREIRKSVESNMEQKRYARGASTITQQVVKMAFLNPEKSLFRKFREALGALILEFILTKDEILEWYINLVEFGDGVFGMQAAAKHYFQTTPELLTIQDGAQLALVIPSPNAWSKGLRQRSLTDFGHARYRRIIEEMYNLGFITAALRRSALATGDFGRPVKGYEPLESDPDQKIDLYPDMPDTRVKDGTQVILPKKKPVRVHKHYHP